MKREEWGFERPTKVLLTAAKSKMKHHDSRLKWYQTQMRAFVKTLKKRGLELRNDLPQALMTVYGSTKNPNVRMYSSTSYTGTTGYAGYSGISGYSGTGTIGYDGKGQIMIEDALTKRLNELNGGLRRHIEALREFDQWVAILSECTEESFTLDKDDWAFFFHEV